MTWYFPFSLVQSGRILELIDASGQIRGIEHYPECGYAAGTRYVFHMDELVRYALFRDVLAGSMERSQ